MGLLLNLSGLQKYVVIECRNLINQRLTRRQAHHPNPRAATRIPRMLRADQDKRCESLFLGGMAEAFAKVYPHFTRCLAIRAESVVEVCFCTINERNLDRSARRRVAMGVVSLPCSWKCATTSWPNLAAVVGLSPGAAELPKPSISPNLQVTYIYR